MIYDKEGSVCPYAICPYASKSIIERKIGQSGYDQQQNDWVAAVLKCHDIVPHRI